jgi:hypothetical protein
MICTGCQKEFRVELCPCPTFNCACRGEYCRLLGRDPLADARCVNCGTAKNQSGEKHE